MILLLLSGITKFSSISISVPNPSQLSHFPKGELNENILGDNSPILIPQSAQAKCSLNNISSPSIIFAITNPSPSFSAVSKESFSLASIPSLITSLSITISIVCFLFFSSLISSSTKSTKFPSILALT